MASNNPQQSLFGSNLSPFGTSSGSQMFSSGVSAQQPVTTTFFGQTQNQPLQGIGGGQSNPTGGFAIGSSSTPASSQNMLSAANKFGTSNGFGQSSTNNQSALGQSSGTFGSIQNPGANLQQVSQPTTGTGLFGQTQQTQPAASIFGGQSSTQQTGLFGSISTQNNLPFGQSPTTSQTTPGTTSIFGQTQPQAIQFQAAPQSNPQSASLLNQTNIPQYNVGQNSAGVFTNQPVTRSVGFGQTSTASASTAPGLLNQPILGNSQATATNSLFGSNTTNASPSTGFGSTNFQQQQKQPAIGFGLSTTSSTLGQVSQPQQQQTSNIFGSAGGAPASGNLFGSTTSGNLFGNNTENKSQSTPSALVQQATSTGQNIGNASASIMPPVQVQQSQPVQLPAVEKSAISQNIGASLSGLSSTPATGSLFTATQKKDEPTVFSGNSSSEQKQATTKQKPNPASGATTHLFGSQSISPAASNIFENQASTQGSTNPLTPQLGNTQKVPAFLEKTQTTTIPAPTQKSKVADAPKPQDKTEQSASTFGTFAPSDKTASNLFGQSKPQNEDKKEDSKQAEAPKANIFGSQNTTTTPITSGLFGNTQKKDENKTSEQATSGSNQQKSSNIFGAPVTSSTNQTPSNLFAPQQKPTEVKQGQTPAEGLTIPSFNLTQQDKEDKSKPQSTNLFQQASNPDTQDQTKNNYSSSSIFTSQQQQSKQHEQAKYEIKPLNIFDSTQSSAPQTSQPSTTPAIQINTQPTQSTDQSSTNQAQQSIQNQQQQQRQQQQQAPSNPIADLNIETLINKWKDQVKRNEEDFQDQSKQLLGYEQIIFDSLDQLKMIENQSSLIQKAYINNAETMNDINRDQDDILGQLYDIEKELDSLMNANLQQNFIDDIINYEDSLDGLTSKQQIYYKARKIETTIDDMSRVFNDVERSINKAEDKKSDCQLVLKYDGQPVKVDETLNLYYEMLLQLENFTGDLNFQINEVEDRMKNAQNQII